MERITELLMMATKKKEQKSLQSLEAKYPIVKNTDKTYNDPVTGALKYKSNYDNDQKQ